MVKTKLNDSIEQEEMTAFNKKKEEARAHLDMAARGTALKQLCIEDRFKFADHAKIDNAFTVPQLKWSAFRPATLLFLPLIIIRVILVIAALADSRNFGLEVVRRGTYSRRGHAARRAAFSEIARPGRRIGASWQGKRWPAASAREGGPRRCLDATEVIEFLLQISFCGRM